MNNQKNIEKPQESKSSKRQVERIVSQRMLKQKLREQRDLCWAAAWDVIKEKIGLELEIKLSKVITNAEEPNF